jgi:FkbM family methyltransferase
MLRKKIFTIYFWALGLNDPFIADGRNLGHYSYLRKFRLLGKWNLIDCGSHQGKFAEGADRYLDMTSIIFVDPNKDYNYLLREKFPNSTILNLALSTHQNEIFYIRNPKNSGQNFISDSIHSNEKVSSISLSNVIDLQNKTPGTKTFLKIDIEGNEIKILKSLQPEVISTLPIISLEITHKINEEDFIGELDTFLPKEFQFYRERRFGLVKVNRQKPHWTDTLKLFQNLILVNTLQIK